MNLPAPGWYADPHRPGGLRWWDGHQWTGHARLPDRPAPPLPQHAGRNEQLGRRALLLWAPLQVLWAALVGYAAGDFLRSVAAYQEAVERSGSAAEPAFPVGSFVLLMVASLGSVLLWVPLVMLLVWQYRAAATAAALRLPAKLDPIWAVVGWLVPVVSLWFPYQSVRDCLPPGHPGRRDVGWWWAGYLASSLGAAGAVVLALVSTPAFVVALLATAVVTAATAVAGLRMVRAVDEAHRSLLRR